MKLTIRTLDQKTISLELNDDKQNVLHLKQRLVELPEISQPVDSLQLIYSGRIMQDDRPISEYNIMEDRFIVLMTKKSVNAVEPPKKNTEAEQKESQQPKPGNTEQLRPAEPPRPSVAPDEQRVRDLVLMGYDEPDVRAALRASFNHPERAIEYLITGIPTDVPAVNQTQTQTHANAADANLIGETAERLNYLATDPHFAHVRDLIRQNPELLELVLTHLRESDPAAFEAIRNNQEEFISMLNAPMPMTATLNTEEEAAVERLMALGFDRDVVVPVYLACDKNEELAADILFRQTDEEDN
ncbi:PREDICTED: UV excision repair protein rhp23 [Drosophila arizonae]|uniref:UV excision repair protein RAD23 n=1 Tax=Drosophila arizonae TaxID=7263 RepID=A0ABM1P0L5_DROAR|nr:PREDICTED: UV excision repair protein rhp23 [Drosophila arizonae]